jgi:hypothetical protein
MSTVQQQNEHHSVVLSGIPSDATKAHILKFFHSISTFSIHPCGCSNIYFPTADEANSARKKFARKVFLVKCEFGISKQVKYIRPSRRSSAGDVTPLKYVTFHFPISFTDAELSSLLFGLNVSEVRHLCAEIVFTEKKHFQTALLLDYKQLLGKTVRVRPKQQFLLDCQMIKQSNAAVKRHPATSKSSMIQTSSKQMKTEKQDDGSARRMQAETKGHTKEPIVGTSTKSKDSRSKRKLTNEKRKKRNAKRIFQRAKLSQQKLLPPPLRVASK